MIINLTSLESAFYWAAFFYYYLPIWLLSTIFLFFFFFHLQICFNLCILMMPCYKLWLFVQQLFTCFVLVMFIMPSKMFIRVIKMKVFIIKDLGHFRSNKSITNISQDHWISINNFFYTYQKFCIYQDNISV